jgi:hypothetical protein
MKTTVKVAAGMLAVAVAAGQGVWAADAKAASSSTRPPKNLKLVGDHWTPWDPPQATPDSYTIQKGDTFWDLSGKWLGNSYLWPQVWDQNRYVLDSHWIYPGDPLMVPGKPTVVPPEGPPPSAEEKPPEPQQPEDNAAATAAAPPVEAPRPTAAPKPAMIQLADAHDLYCSGWIEPKHDPAALVIAGAELEKLGNATQDIVYLNQGRNQGVNAGNEYLSVRPDHKVVHPRTSEKMGVFLQRIGHLRVLCAQEDTAIAVVLSSCEDVRPGDELVPWKDMQGPAMEKLPPVDRCMQPSGLAQGYVVDGGSDQLHATGTGHVVNSDIGAAAGIRPGSILTIYRDNGDLPRKVLGEGVVLTVDGDTSAVKIVQSAREVLPGDRVEVLQQ